MRQLIKAGRTMKLTRLAIATDDLTESRIKFQAETRHLSNVSRYCETILRAHLDGLRSLRGRPIAAQAKHLEQDISVAEADGRIDPIEREEITDHISDILSDVRMRAS